MKRRTIVIVTAAIALVALSASALLAGAIGYHGLGPCGDPGEFMLQRLDCRMQALGLSEAQQAEYARIRAGIQADMEQGRALHDELHQVLAGELDKDAPDLRVMAQAMESRFDTVEALVTKHMDHMLEIYDMLDAEQQAKVLDHIREHMCEIGACQDM